MHRSEPTLHPTSDQADTVGTECHEMTSCTPSAGSQVNRPLACLDSYNPSNYLALSDQAGVQAQATVTFGLEDALPRGFLDPDDSVDDQRFVKEIDNHVDIPYAVRARSEDYLAAIT